MDTLNTGDKLTHAESGSEAEYVTALPTAGHGFIHLLKSASGYIFRLTGDLENEFSKAGETATLAQTGAPADGDLMAQFESMLRRLGVVPGNVETAKKVTAPDSEGSSSDTGKVDLTQPPPLIPNAAAHLPETSAEETPAEEETNAAVEPSAEPVTPPANAIPY